MTFGAMLEEWPLVEADMHEIYGIDLGDRSLLQSRTWRWLFVRLVGLLSTECRIQRVLNPTPEQQKAQQQHRD